MTNTPWGFDYSSVGNSLFGHEDLYRAQAQGATSTQIRDWLNRNPDALWEGNRAGGEGGLMDLLNTGASAESNEQAWEDRFAEMQQQFSEQMGQYTAQLGEMNQERLDFEERQWDFDQQQADLQRQYQDRMLAAQNRVRGSTPTHVKQPASQMAIGPGRVAMPQSASSLARKPTGKAPLVSGLNIGGVRRPTNTRMGITQ